VVLLEDASDLVVDAFRLSRVAARRDNEEIGEVADAAHVENRDVGRQLLLAESGNAAGLLERAQIATRSLVVVNKSRV
jgi:hypothetical protein